MKIFYKSEIMWPCWIFFLTLRNPNHRSTFFHHPTWAYHLPPTTLLLQPIPGHEKGREVLPGSNDAELCRLGQQVLFFFCISVPHQIPPLSTLPPDKIFTLIQVQCLHHLHLPPPQSQLRSLADVSVLGHRLVSSPFPSISGWNSVARATTYGSGYITSCQPESTSTLADASIKSTYGGNLFTSDDVLYLKKYIDYCQNQCLVLRCVYSCLAILVSRRYFLYIVYVKFARGLQSRYGT